LIKKKLNFFSTEGRQGGDTGVNNQQKIFLKVNYSFKYLNECHFIQILCGLFLGSSEGEAKLIAFQNALRSLAPLFGYDSLTGAESAEAVQNQLSSMLKGVGQKDPVIYLKPMEQANIQLSFCDYMLKCSCQSSKKAARNHLSARILGLLGVKTGQST